MFKKSDLLLLSVFINNLIIRTLKFYYNPRRETSVWREIVCVDSNVIVWPIILYEPYRVVQDVFYTSLKSHSFT